MGSPCRTFGAVVQSCAKLAMGFARGDGGDFFCKYDLVGFGGIFSGNISFGYVPQKIPLNTTKYHPT